MRTSINIQKTTLDILKRLKRYKRETYDEVITRLADNEPKKPEEF